MGPLSQTFFLLSVLLFSVSSVGADLCSDEIFSFLLNHLVPQIDDVSQESKGTVLIFGEKEFSLQPLVSEHKYNKVEFQKFATPESLSSLPSLLPESSVVICLGVAQFLGRDPSEGHSLSAQLVSLLTASRPRVVIFGSSSPLDYLLLSSAQQAVKQNLSAVASPHLVGFLEEMLQEGSLETAVWRNERPNSFWIDLFDTYGYQYSVVSTGTARNMAFSILNQQSEEECQRNECFLLSRLSFFARNALVFFPKSNHIRLTQEQNSLARDPTSINALGWFNFNCVLSINWLSGSSNIIRTLTALFERDRLEYLALFSQYKVQWFTQYLNQILRSANYTTSLYDHIQATDSSRIMPLAGTYCSITPQKNTDCQPSTEQKENSQPDEKWKQLIVVPGEQNLLSQDISLQTMQMYADGKHIDLLFVMLTQLMLIQKYQLYRDEGWLQKEARWVVLPLLTYLAQPDLHLPATHLSLELVARSALIQELEKVVPGVNLDVFIEKVLSNSEKHADKVSEGFKLQTLISPQSTQERKEILKKGMDDYRFLDVWTKSSL